MNSIKLEEVKNQATKLLKEDKIEETNSLWNSPILLVPKKNGESRMCIDFRKINEYTLGESCPPPVIEECLASLAGNKYFSTIDLQCGYHQIFLDTKSRPYTAFTTPLGKFQYKTMPFGLKNAPSYFQNLMYLVLKRYVNKICIVYMDDIVIYSKTIDQHYKDLRFIVLYLAENGLCINFEKCLFASDSISFLGFNIKGNILSPDTKKIKVFEDIGEIKTLKKLHSILGLLNYYRGFIENFSKKVSILNEMIARKIEFNQDMAEKIVRPLASYLSEHATLDYLIKLGNLLLKPTLRIMVWEVF